jgi:hypothetical protein
MEHICAFCNEAIEEIDVQFGDVRIVEDEYWHIECFQEEFGEDLEEILEEA